MKSLANSLLLLGVLAVTCLCFTDASCWGNEKSTGQEQGKPRLTLSREKNMLTIHGDHIPGGKIPINYLEAYCRANSTDADWGKHTVVKHETQTISLNEDRTVLKLKCTVADGVTVQHTITAKGDEVDFQLVAHNPTDRRSEVHWAQPCIRVGEFAGLGASTTDDKYAYIKKSFVFLDGKPAFMPTRNWATQARYVPGQVWCPLNVPRTDVNPRPLSEEVPSNGLIGCYSGNNQWIFATAFEPYQELFQGVIRCLHADFRLGGLQPGETKTIRGKIYIVPADMDALVKRYQRDFPEHVKQD
ncbi:hypothetical protein [Gimesia sp.]|uniref:hypothetical protein n=1 Tax=Gimesia sp. TaxID=2024833 RepID=UPI003A927B43